MSSGEFQGFLCTAFRQMAKVSRSGSIHFICMDWRHVGELIGAGDEIYFRAEKYLRLGQIKWRHGLALSLPT